MTILDALKELSNYPVPHRVFEKAAIKGGISLDDEYTSKSETDSGYLTAKAHVLRWLSAAVPVISELGISFTLQESEKLAFKREADRIESAQPAYGIRFQ